MTCAVERTFIAQADGKRFHVNDTITASKRISQLLENTSALAQIVFGSRIVHDFIITGAQIVIGFRIEHDFIMWLV